MNLSLIRDALVWAQQNLGKHTRPSPIDKALAELDSYSTGRLCDTTLPDLSDDADHLDLGDPADSQIHHRITTGPDGDPIHAPLTKEQVINNIRLMQELGEKYMENCDYREAIGELVSVILQRGIA